MMVPYMVLASKSLTRRPTSKLVASAVAMLKVVAVKNDGVLLRSMYSSELTIVLICAIISRAQSFTVEGACPSSYGQPSGGVELFDPGVVDHEPTLDMAYSYSR